MKKYRLGYVYHLIQRKEKKIVDSLLVDVLFKAYDSKGNEILFTHEEAELESIKIFGCSLSSLYCCSIHEEDGVKLISKMSSESQVKEKVIAEIIGFSHYLNSNDPKGILIEQAKEFIKNNYTDFDYSENYQAQSVAYFLEEVK